MERKVSVEALRKGGLFIGTPLYNQQTHGPYTSSMIHLAALCGRYGIEVGYVQLTSPYVTTGRNQICSEFLEDDIFTHLMFIDSDIGFNPVDVLALKGLMTDDSPYDIMGGAYTPKKIDWSVVRDAVLAGKGKDNPDELEKYTSGRYFIIAKEQANVASNEPMEARGVATGFMMIKKSALQTFAEKYPQYLHLDHNLNRNIMQFFQTEIVPESNHYQSEDYWFCQKATDIGLKVWACPWMQLTHTGPYTWRGNMVDTIIMLDGKRRIVD